MGYKDIKSRNLNFWMENLVFGPLCSEDGWIISYIKVLELDIPKFFCLEISCPCGAIGRALDLGSKGPRFESQRGFLKVWAKKIWCGRIFLYGYSEPLDINIEGLDSILLRKELFIQIHFGGLWIIQGFFSEMGW